MITAADVRQAYEAINGPSDLSEKVLEKAAKYGNLNENESAADVEVMIALDIFRLQESGDFLE